MTANKRACCPLCGRTTATYVIDGRRFYVQHHPTNRGRSSVLADPSKCGASGWLVEDDELVVTPRKTRSDAGVARPPRAEAWVHRCTGNRPECTRRNPCSDGCRPYPPEPKKENER